MGLVASLFGQANNGAFTGVRFLEHPSLTLDALVIWSRVVGNNHAQLGDVAVGHGDNVLEIVLLCFKGRLHATSACGSRETKEEDS
jgi:hypothetical protein